MTAQDRYIKSCRSAETNCVEVAQHTDGVAMRDSKNPDAGVLVFCRAAWSDFLAAVRGGDYDRKAQQ